MLNWIVWKRTNYMYKNGFGIKKNLQKLIRLPTTQFVFFSFFLFITYIKRKQDHSPLLFPPLFLFSEKISTLFIRFPNKTNGYTSLFRSLWSSVMLASPEVGDHFTLNLYNKVIPLHKFWNIGTFLKINSLRISFLAICMYIKEKKEKEKVESDF